VKLRTEMTVGQLAAHMHLPPRVIYRLLRSGEMPGAKTGKHWRVTLEEVQDWMLKVYEAQPQLNRKMQVSAARLARSSPFRNA
jgi:excisionase family DNA binding protein